jgi:molybdopterin converting factor subunit 1
MKIRILLFAAAREMAQRPSIEVETSSGVSIETLRQKIASDFPQLKGIMATSRFAVNQAFVDDAAMVDDRCEVACIPPVSGG